MIAADLVIEELSDREADLLEANRQMADLVADLAFENELLRLVSQTFIERIRHLTRELHCQRVA